MPMNTRSLLMSGGGMDSISLLVLCPKPDGVIWFDYGQKAAVGEFESNKYFCQKYNIPFHAVPITDLSKRLTSPILKGSYPNQVSGESWKPFLEGNRLEARNLLLLSHAVVFGLALGYAKIMTGFHKEPDDAPFPDATESFYERFMLAAKEATREDITFSAPFQEWEWDRIDILSRSLVEDPEIWNAHDCYESLTDKPCGHCVHCVKRQEWKQQLIQRGVIIDAWN